MEFIYKMNDGSIIKLESYDLLNHIVYGFNFGYNIYKKALLIENGKKKSITIRLKENEYSSSKEYDGVTLSLYRKNIELLETLKDELYKECDYALNYNKDDLILLKKRKWSK